MGAASFAIGLAVLIGYLFHYLTYTLAIYGKFGLQLPEVEERAKKMYLFGIIGVLSIHFTTVYGAIFAWMSFAALMLFYLSAFFKPEYNKRKYFVLGGILYSGMLMTWWIGQTVAIFINLNV